MCPFESELCLSPTTQNLPNSSKHHRLVHGLNFISKTAVLPTASCSEALWVIVLPLELILKKTWGEAVISCPLLLIHVSFPSFTVSAEVKNCLLWVNLCWFRDGLKKPRLTSNSVQLRRTLKFWSSCSASYALRSQLCIPTLSVCGARNSMLWFSLAWQTHHQLRCIRNPFVSTFDVCRLLSEVYWALKLFKLWITHILWGTIYLQFGLHFTLVEFL